MKKIFILSFLLIVILCASNSNAQVSRKADPIICPVDHHSYDTFVPPKNNFSNLQFSRSENQANIIVNYSGFTEEAQEAFQYAVDIWASLLKSPVQIIVNAEFKPLNEGVLGAAGPNGYIRDFEGAPLKSTFYPIPLAEKLARENFNGSDEADIVAEFNSDFDFYFGLDGDTPSDQYDFVSIVLHELGHGLGFTGGLSFDVNEDVDSWSLRNTEFPSVYTQYVELGSNTPIINLPDNSTETGDALIGGDLFFNGPYSLLELEQRPKLYAPEPYNQGSSYSHLDENEYRAGNPNSLMSPRFGSGEAIHDPGVTLDMFADMGWIHTYLEHENKFQITENKTEPFLVTLTIISDTALSEENPVVIYSTDNFGTSETIELIESPEENVYEAEIPNPGENTIIRYYFSGVKDVASREFKLPTDAPESFYEINIIDIDRVALPYTLADGGDFESSQTDFQSIALDGGINLWQLGTPENRLSETVSGEKVWKTKLGENIGKQDKRVSSALISPIFDFSDDTKNHLLSFSFTMENVYTEEDGLLEDGPFGLQVQFSLDEGASWELLGDINDDAGSNWYNKSESSPLVFPETSNAGWIQQTIEVVDGDTTFIPLDAAYNVSFLTGFDQVNFRIVFYAAEGFTDTSYEADGVLIDDFEILKSSPTAEFTNRNSDLIFAGDEVEFEYISAGATSFEWDFGDGNTSNLEDPTHIYTEGGSYDVSLTISSPDGEASLTKEAYVTVVESKTVPYKLVDGGDLEGQNIDFTIENISGTGFEIGQSTIAGKAGTASGDNAIVTEINVSQYQNNSEAYIYTPEFEFESLGDYELSFETNYSFEDNWDGFIVEYTLDRGESWLKLNNERVTGWYTQISDPQSVFGNQVPIFSGNTGNAFERKFTDISFLGGVGNVSFRIKFLTDAAEIDAGMAFDNFEINGPEPGPAIADFSSSFQSGCEGLTVVFTNESVGSIKELNWDFGDGAEPRTASGVGPHEVKYDNSGAYTVILTATGVNDLLSSEEKEGFIFIQEEHTPSINISEPDNDGNITLTASEGDSYQWFYRDAIVVDANQQNLVVQESGNYKVTVVINGCEGTSENTLITSNDSPLARSFSVYPNPIEQNSELNISFENEYFGEYNIEFYGMDGRLILSESFEKISQKEERGINTTQIFKGLYLVRITTGKQTTQSKVLIE